jgi:hypothetical protein
MRALLPLFQPSRFRAISTLAWGLSLLLLGCQSLWSSPFESKPSLTTQVSLAARAELPRAELPEVSQKARATVTNETVHNDEATIPPQCYTKTERRHNPCYTCHQSYPESATRLNQMNDGGNQGEYSFSDVGQQNHWQNLFAEKAAFVAAISDTQIERYVEQDNYSDLRGRLIRQGFKGYMPDLRDYAEGAKAFDARGLARDQSGWVAFKYKPFPGTFWPTNGSYDDVAIRLPKSFRERGGQFDSNVYAVNVALAELELKEQERVILWDIDESKLGTDIDQDGVLGRTKTVVRRSHYIGDATGVPCEPEQLPEGTEFIHSVRYLRAQGEKVSSAPRMKELRYMRKVSGLTFEKARAHYARERKEKLEGALPNFVFLGDEGFDGGLGWYVAGFIEDYAGDLRPQSREEGLYCMGCHSAVGTTRDSTFSFARKVPGGAGFGYIDLERMLDAPSQSGTDGDILEYLERAGGGSEFRENPEMLARWFLPDGRVDRAKVASATVAELITPSRERALELNKAYAYIVRHQSYVFGRDAHVAPATNVFRTVPEDTVPLTAAFRYAAWDIRLRWD